MGFFSGLSRQVDGGEGRDAGPAFRPASPANSSDLDLEHVLPEGALQSQYSGKKQPNVQANGSQLTGT